MTDDDIKKLELGAQQQKQQQQPPQENDTSSGLVEAVAVQVLDDGRPQQEQQQAGVVIHRHYIVSSPAPSVRNSDAQCCYPITTDDPVEVVQARNVAIAHIIVEIVGIAFCSSAWCGVMAFLAGVSSIFVACCFKLRRAFMLWSLTGVVLFVLHANVAREAIGQEASEYGWSPAVLFLAQILQCVFSLLVVHVGCKTASAIRRQPICPVQSGIGTPLQLSTHPVAAAGVQQHSPVIHMLPQLLS